LKLEVTYKSLLVHRQTFAAEVRQHTTPGLKYPPGPAFAAMFRIAGTLNFIAKLRRSWAIVPPVP